MKWYKNDCGYYGGTGYLFGGMRCPMCGKNKKKGIRMKEIKLGTACTDVITGFTGAALSKVTHITGCDRYELQPKINAEGVVKEAAWVYVNRLKVEDAEVIELKTNVEKGAGNVPHGRVL